MQQTNQYKLNLIESGDTFSAQPINENTEKLEGALLAQVQAIEDAKASGLQVVTGSYTGTGTYGSKNKNTLTFPFDPLVLILAQADSGHCAGVWLQGTSSGISYISDNDAATVILTWTDRSVSWQNPSGSLYQLNESGRTYRYIALGLN